MWRPSKKAGEEYHSRRELMVSGNKAFRRFLLPGTEGGSTEGGQHLPRPWAHDVPVDAVWTLRRVNAQTKPNPHKPSKNLAGLQILGRVHPVPCDQSQQQRPFRSHMHTSPGLSPTFTFCCWLPSVKKRQPRSLRQDLLEDHSNYPVPAFP